MIYPGVKMLYKYIMLLATMRLVCCVEKRIELVLLGAAYDTVRIKSLICRLLGYVQHPHISNEARKYEESIKCVTADKRCRPTS